MSILDIERQIGEQRGEQRGRQEGEQIGELIGAIRATQQHDGKPVTPKKTLAEKTLDQLRDMLALLSPNAAALTL